MADREYKRFAGQSVNNAGYHNFNWDLFHDGNELRDVSYASLSAAITAIGSAEKTLFITKQWNITSSLTIPANISVVVLKGGFFNISSGKTLRILGPFHAGIYRAFSGLGTATLSNAEKFIPQWWGAKGDGVTDDSAAIQAAINAGQYTYFPLGIYLVKSTLTITNKNGFMFIGSGMVQTSIKWGGAAGGTILRMRGSWFTKIADMFLDCASLADTALDLPCYFAGAGDTYVATMNTLDRLRMGNTRNGTGTALSIGDGTGSQLDNLTVNKCWIENAGKLATITGVVVFHIHFIDCVFSGYSVIPTTVGIDIISGGLVYFTGCQFVGSGPTIAYVRRSPTAESVGFKNCEMESTGAFWYGTDDSGFANTWPVTMENCVIGFTGAAATNIIDHRQRSPFLITGGDINSSNAANINFAAPGSVGSIGGLFEDIGVRYANVTVVLSGASQRFKYLSTGDFGVGTFLTINGATGNGAASSYWSFGGAIDVTGIITSAAQLIATHATKALLTLKRLTVAAATDEIATLQSQALNSASANKTFFEGVTIVDNGTSTSEASSWAVRLMRAGAQVTAFLMGGDGTFNAKGKFSGHLELEATDVLGAASEPSTIEAYGLNASSGRTLWTRLRCYVNSAVAGAESADWYLTAKIAGTNRDALIVGSTGLKGYSLVGTGTRMLSADSTGLIGTTLTSAITLWTKTASTTIANSTTETTLLDTGVGSKTLAAAFLTVGKSIVFEISGVYSTTLTPTIQFKFKLGSTVILDTGAVTTANTVTNQPFRFFGSLTCRSTGAAGTVFAQGELLLGGVATPLIGVANTGTSTIDTTGTLAMDITSTWGSLSVSDTITSTNAVIESKG